ncbi:hypothetical protein FOMG_13852 [Fusarium oxysporum f. sp. melonis 26406]|uniref:Uncharacterized protein n=1 Tax=Fusarium oxysporum f. sp. melonis 26406 TaxID=1089452 RepID=W9ZNT9_FUSOX|nr:hypothetical protein FOMG_13852 [Fusarium oxysporum f. sp. melonis 26406]
MTIQQQFDYYVSEPGAPMPEEHVCVACKVGTRQALEFLCRACRTRSPAWNCCNLCLRSLPSVENRGFCFRCVPKQRHELSNLPP